MATDRRNHNRQDLRVLCKNMVYCSGLPSNLTNDQLTSDSYFGQYGKIQKIVVNVFPNRNYCSVYLTYSDEFEAATAILACNQYSINRSTLWCLFGTMKYCKYFLKKIQCKSMSSCPYVHAFDYKNEIQIQNSPAQAYPEHEKLAKQVIRKHPQRVKRLRQQDKEGGQLPEPMCAVDLVFPPAQQGAIGNRIVKSTPQPLEPEIVKSIQEQQNQRKQEQNKLEEQIVIDIEHRIKKLILKKLEKAKGSRVMGDIKQQEKNVRQIIMSGLLD